jgi:hypothetical protein
MCIILKKLPSGARTDCFPFVAMGMAKNLKTENKMLDDFEEELEECRYFDRLK